MMKTITRVERSKSHLDERIKKLENKEKAIFIFQELINQLPTYNEQKELSRHYENIKEKKVKK